MLKHLTARFMSGQGHTEGLTSFSEADAVSICECVLTLEEAKSCIDKRCPLVLRITYVVVTVIAGDDAVLPGRSALLALEIVGLQGGEVVDRRKLNQRERHEGEAHGDEPVHGGGVGDLGQRVAGADAQGGHGQDRSDAWNTQAPPEVEKSC